MSNTLCEICNAPYYATKTQVPTGQYSRRHMTRTCRGRWAKASEVRAIGMQVKAGLLRAEEVYALPSLPLPSA